MAASADTGIDHSRDLNDELTNSVIHEFGIACFRSYCYQQDMGIIVGIVSQKGGVGKSTLARLLAREYAKAGWNVKIADLDVSQGTSFNWQARRLRNNVEPVVAVERFGSVEQALKIAEHYDLLILDGPPTSSAGTLKIATAADLILLPTGLALDDLEPTILLAHELVKNGLSKEKIAVALSRVGDSEVEIAEARQYIKDAGYEALNGELPEKLSFRRASDAGRALSETTFPTLNARSDAIAQSIVNRLTGVQTQEKEVFNG